MSIKFNIFMFSLIVCILVTGCNSGNTPGDNLQDNRLDTNSDRALNDLELTRFYRNASNIDFGGLAFTPWDVEKASKDVIKREKKPYTIMVYMNGSDLESEMGSATDDIIEMQRSGVNADHVNLILFTGGTNRWHNSVVPANECVIWEIANGKLERLTGVGLINMGDPGTLSSFIDFSVKNFPADQYGLIMWDHGGGSIAGFGDDENFNNNYLTLLDMNYAFEKSELSKNKLEFLGFDSCLMATVEMAVIASNYANYLIASVDIEPYDGWDYSFLSALNHNPNIDGAALGKVIVDSFMDYYGDNAKESLALSVIDISNADRIMGALGGLMRQCSDSLLADRESSFKRLATRRRGTKTFGVGSPRDNESDMVDIRDMAIKLSDLFPNETATLLAELDNTVVYNRHNSDADLGGLSVYYIYGGKTIGDMSLNTYASLNMDSNYTIFLNDFYRMLVADNKTRRGRSSVQEDRGGDELISMELTIWQPTGDGYIMTGIQTSDEAHIGEIMKAGMNSLWPSIEGKSVCLYNINNTVNSAIYAIPAAINGNDCDIIVSFSEEYPQGKILGARMEDGIVIQKGYDPISKGDKISFYYFARNHDTGDVSWYKSDEWIVKEELRLDWSALRGEEYYSLLLTDIRHDRHFTGLKAVA